MSSETIALDQLAYRACKLNRITRDEPGAGELAKMERLIEFLRPHLVAQEAAQRKGAVSFDDWYVQHSFDYERHPLGSRECELQREGWDAALAAKPTGDTCTCPTCGDWYAAEDIDRMVKEISDALGSTATHPKLCDIVVETVRAVREDAAQPRPMDLSDGLPFDDDVQEILGRMCFQCISIAGALRKMGHVIDRKAEAEQASVLHWLLGHYLRSGKEWRAAASDELKAAAPEVRHG